LAARPHSIPPRVGAQGQTAFGAGAKVVGFRATRSCPIGRELASTAHRILPAGPPALCRGGRSDDRKPAPLLGRSPVQLGQAQSS